MEREIKGTMEMKPMRLIPILAAALCAAGMGVAVENRSFDMEIVSVDPASRTLVVAALPDSGKRFTLQLTDQSMIRADRELPFEQIPLDRPVGVFGKVFTKGTQMRGEHVSYEQDTLAATEVVFSGSPAFKPTPRPAFTAVLRKEDGHLVAETDGKKLAFFRGEHDQVFPMIWSCDLPGAVSDLEAGLTGEVSYREEAAGNTVVALSLKIQKRPYASCYVAPENHKAEPVERIRANVEKIKAAHAAIADELDKLAPVDLRVSPSLLKAGEKPTLTIRALSEKKPSGKLTVYPDYLKNGTEKGMELTLDWQSAKDDKARPIHTAKLELPAGKPGNYLVHWKCDIGGDIEDYWRTYAVVDDRSIVCLLNDCGTDDLTDRKMLLENKLAHTYWMGEAMFFDKMLKPATAAWWAETSRAARQFGIEPQLFFFNTTWDAIPLGELNFNGDREDYIREVLHAYKELWPLYRYPQECENVGSYAYSTAFSRAMLAEGFSSMNSVCPVHILEHAPGQKINTHAMGHYPHYISTQDFRKTGNETGRNSVSISQFTGQHLRNRQGAECFDCTEPYWLNLDWNNQAGPRGDFTKNFFSRTFHQADLLLRNSRNNPDHPTFFITGLEFASSSPKTPKPSAKPGDRVQVEYLVGKAKAGEPVVFATGNAIADYLRRHFPQSPRHVNYFHDYLAGTTQRLSPLEVSDSIDIEDAQFRAVMSRPNILPEFHYDYTKDWKYPDFGNEGVWRPYWITKQIGGRLRCKYDVTPSIEDWRDLKVSRKDEPGKTHRVTLTVESPLAAERVPLAVWDIPREWKPGKDWFKTKNVREFIPVVAPETDNLNGVLVVDLKKGMNTFSVEIATPARELKTMDTTFADAVRAKTWTHGTHDGRPVTYLWPVNPWGAEVTVTIPEGKTATAYLTPDTKEQELTAGVYKFNLRFQQWLRLIGLTQAEINQSVNVK